MSLWYFTGASPYAGALFTFPETRGGFAVSAFRVWPNLLGFNQKSFFQSLSHTHIATSVKDLVCNHTKCNGQNPPQSYFSLILPIHHVLLLTPVCYRVILDFTASRTTYFLSPNLPLPPLYLPNPVFFFFFLIATNICILSQQYLLHPSLHYHFNQVPSIHARMRSFSNPVILSIWLFSYIPLPRLSIPSCLRNLLSYTLHTSLLCWPLPSFFHGTLTHLTL